MEWSVLAETSEKGVYREGQTTIISDPKLIGWLIEASLHARSSGSAPLREILAAPYLFPFRLCHISADHLAAGSPRLGVLRHGLDDDLIMNSRVEG